MGEKTEKIEKIEKSKGKMMNEIILDMEKGTGASSQVSRILDSQTEMLAKRLERSNMEQLMAESERKRIEEEHRLRAAEQGEMPPTPPPQQAPQEAKNILEAVKVGLEAGKPQKSEGGSIGEIIKGMADMFKTGVEVGTRSSQSQQQPQQNSLETMKTYHEMFLKPVLDQLNSKEKEIMTMRMNQIESKITAQVSPQEYIKQITEGAKSLGYSIGTDPMVMLKAKEMDQTERLENRRIDFATEERMQKREDEKEGVKQLYGLIGQVVGADGVVGKLASNLGSIAKTRLERDSSKSNNPNPEVDPSKIKTISCPKCGKPIRIFEGSTAVLCSNCDAVLGLQTQPQQPQQPQEQPPTMQPQETPTSPSASEAQQPAEASQPVQEPAKQ